MESSLIQLRCPACDGREVLSPPQVLARLQSVGMLRRENEPTPDLVAELVASAAAQFCCPRCGKQGLSAEPFCDDDEWDDARSCQQCGQAISSERRSVFPDTVLCMNCQQAQDQGESNDEPEFCPRCGALMTLKQSSRGGITRYVSKCTECRF